jgi:hypothetical protein
VNVSDLNNDYKILYDTQNVDIPALQASLALMKSNLAAIQNNTVTVTPGGASAPVLTAAQNSYYNNIQGILNSIDQLLAPTGIVGTPANEGYLYANVTQNINSFLNVNNTYTNATVYLSNFSCYKM